MLPRSVGGHNYVGIVETSSRGFRTLRSVELLRRVFWLHLIGLTFAGPSPAQARPLGLELRAYPAGLIPAIRTDWSLASNFSLTAIAGYNLTDRRSWGEHDHESGHGPGGGLGLTRAFRPDRRGLRLGIRADLWHLGIDWRDSGSREGNTKVWVLQPTGRIAYAWGNPSRKLRFELSANLGAEFNVSTRGERVGQGPILLLGLGMLGLR